MAAYNWQHHTKRIVDDYETRSSGKIGEEITIRGQLT